MSNDALLLRRYTEEHSEPAFRELVQRHLPLVYSSALRRCNGNTHAAADVAQRVFIALAQQARFLMRHAVLTAWLYATTRNIAVDFVRAEQRRHAHEQLAHTMQEIVSPAEASADWNQLRPVLEHIMDELGDADREAVLLRFFDQRSFAEIGAALKVSEDAARMRTDRALDKLRALLAKRGIASTSTALALVLANQAVGTVPAGLAADITGASLLGAAAAAPAGLVAATIAFMTATKTAAVMGVAALIAITTAVYQSIEARSSAAMLATTNKEYVAARVRLEGLRDQSRTAELTLAEREKAVAQLAAMKSVASGPKLAAEAKTEAANQQKALQDFLDNDPELQILKRHSTHAWFIMSHSALLRSIGFTDQQIEQAVAMMTLARQQEDAQRAAGVKPIRTGPPFIGEFRAAFGDAAADRFLEYSKTRWGDGDAIVRSVASALYHTEEPLRADQVKRLSGILEAAKITDETTRKLVFDWDRVLSEAEPMLSPTQLRGLSAQAANARVAAMWAAASRDASATARK